MNETTQIGLTLLSREEARVLLADLPLCPNAAARMTWRSWVQNASGIGHFQSTPCREEVEAYLKAGYQVIFAEQSQDDVLHVWIIFPSQQAKRVAELAPHACRAAALSWLKPSQSVSAPLPLTLPVTLTMNAAAQLTLELGFATATLSVTEALLLADHLHRAAAGHNLDETTPIPIFSSGATIILEGQNQRAVWLCPQLAIRVAQHIERLANLRLPTGASPPSTSTWP
ncbi:hypothetical protein EHF33_15990 [Deinococcus psychrotolerans]|uniref:Uncharacterized protein n=1 Tax=Deinococcus psychrotolerans TaxID=2489213 RepID=A0A3G8YHQ7_9DEIO|nr:hypothetical protein [Deinococcus psychrotolerans]AZI44380.1 hypothetical protein EHF33_15990 [Deinococcus psychrotolerans]